MKNKFFLAPVIKRGLQVAMLLAISLFNFTPGNTGIAHAVVCYTLTLNGDPVAGLSGFTVTPPSPGCGSDYPSGTSVQIQANAAANYVFASWSGSASGTTNPVNLTMDANKSVTAKFFADIWQAALPITIPFSISGTTTQAGSDVNVPKPSPCYISNNPNPKDLRTGLASVWFKYTPAANKLVSLDTLGSTTNVTIPPPNTDPSIKYDYDTYIAVWDDAIDSNPALVFCNDDNDAGRQSQLGFNAQAGVTYYIQVGQFDGIDGPNHQYPGYTGGNLQFHAGYGSQTDVYIGGTLKGSYEILQSNSKSYNYDGLKTGPVRVISTNGVKVIPSERAYRNTANFTDFNEMMGIPANQVTTEYWFPWYDNTSFMATWVVIGNASTDAVNHPSATVDVYIGGNKRGTYVVPYGDRAYHYDVGQKTGPVRVVSTNAVPIITSERAYRNATNLTDFTEMMGLPASQLTTEYWFPWYDNTSFMATWVVIGNASTDAVNHPSATVDVYIGGNKRGTYVIPYGDRAYHYDVGQKTGPVRVVSTNAVPIITSERAYRNATNLTDFNELMGIPASQLTTEYWFPWYDNTSFMATWVVIGNAQ